jgi:thioredoxin-like negative regulator of GroEL
MASKDLHEINDLNFEDVVLAAEPKVLLELGAPWCPPCKLLVPALERLAAEHGPRLRVGVVDVDDSPGIATRLAPRALPTLVVFEGGREVARHVGLATALVLTRLVTGR